MRALHRRLPRLKDRFGPPVATEYMRQLQRRIEAGRSEGGSSAGRNLRIEATERHSCRANVSGVRKACEAPSP
jgi:hypothetical protein